MVIETKTNKLSIADAIQLRQQADELLNRLISEGEQSERRFAETGKRDPMKFITGRTALENAIASTREMIGNMDRLLQQLNGELDLIEPVSVCSSRNGSMSHTRNGLALSGV